MMTQPTSSQFKWRAIFEKQQLANAERWLTILTEEENPASMVIAEHDNLLRALEISLQKEDTFDLTYRLIDQLFPIVIGYGDWERWLIYLEEAIDLSQNLRMENEEAHLLSLMGDILIFKGEHQKAYDLYRKCIEIYKRLGDDERYANALANLASAHDLQGDFKKGLELLEEASRISKSRENQLVLMRVNLSLSTAYYRLRKWSPGLSAAQMAYELAGQLGDSQKEMQSLINIIAFQTELGNWQEVETLSPQIEETLVATGDLLKLSQFKNNMGITAFNQGQYFVAEKAWQDALQINLQIELPVELAKIYNNLGMVYTKLGEIDAAESMLIKAANIFEKMGDLYNWANALDNLADVYEVKGDVVKFRESLEFALTLLSNDSPEPHVQDLISIINGRLINNSQ